MRIPNFFVKVAAACGNPRAKETWHIQTMPTSKLIKVGNIHSASNALEPGAAPFLLPRANFVSRQTLAAGRLHSVSNPAPLKDPWQQIALLPNPFRIPRPKVKPVPPPVVRLNPVHAQSVDHTNVRQAASQLEDRSSWLHNAWRQQNPIAPSSSADSSANATVWSPVNVEQDVLGDQVVSHSDIRSSWLHNAWRQQNPMATSPSTDASAGAAAWAPVNVEQDAMSNQVAWQGDVMPPTDNVSVDSACPSTTDVEQSVCSDSEPGDEDRVDSGWDEEWPSLTDEEQRKADAQFEFETLQLEALEASMRGQFFHSGGTVNRTPVSAPAAQKPLTQLLPNIVIAAKAMAAQRGHFTDPRVDRSRSGAKESLALSKAGKALFNGMDAMLRTHEGQLTRAADDSGNASHAFDATSDGWASESEA